MAAKTLEERVKLLEEINEQQRQRIQRLEDIDEIQKLMGRYVYLHEVGRDPEFTDMLFAQETPGVSWEVAHMGIFKGRDGIKRTLDAHGIMSKGPGKLFIHTLTTPVIEIAGDGRTAKGVWISPGAETVEDPQSKEMKGFWAWTKYGCDFVKEDGRWKMWHYHVYRIFLTPCDKSFTEEYEMKMDASKEAPSLEKFTKPDAPPSYDNPYSRKYIADLVPAPPDPYETFGETFSYGPK
jgi:hypothetical protein